MIEMVVGLGYAAAAALGAAAATPKSPVIERLGIATRAPRDPLALLGRRIRRSPPLLAERLEVLGRSRELDRLRGASAVCAGAGVLVGLMVTGWSPAGLVVGPLAGVAGWRLPAFGQARRAASTRARMAHEAADLLDLVTVGLSAGLTPRLAIDRAVDHARDPLARWLRRARREVRLGAAWPALLDELGARLGLGDLRRLASTLERSQRLGSPAVEPIRALAREARAEREAAAEARARRAPVTMLFPLVLCILPAFVLAAVVPAMLVATRGVP